MHIRSFGFACLLLANAVPAAAQVPLFTTHPLEQADQATYRGMQVGYEVVRVPVQVNARALAAPPHSVLVQLPTWQDTIATVRRFDPNMEWPVPPELPDDELAYYLSAAGDASELLIGVHPGGGLTGDITLINNDVYGLLGRHDAGTLIWYDIRLFGTELQIPPPPETYEDQQLDLVLLAPESGLRPGVEGSLEIRVRNAGPDDAVGAVVVFDQPPLFGRLQLASRLQSPGREYGACAQHAFPVRGIPGMQVLRITIPPLASGASTSCVVPVTKLDSGTVRLRAVLRGLRHTGLETDTDLANNHAELVLAGTAPAPVPTPVTVPGPGLPLLAALAAMIAGAARVRLRTAGATRGRRRASNSRKEGRRD